jgi:hypothetical protein
LAPSQIAELLSSPAAGFQLPFGLLEDADDDAFGVGACNAELSNDALVDSPRHPSTANATPALAAGSPTQLVLSSHRTTLDTGAAIVAESRFGSAKQASQLLDRAVVARSCNFGPAWTPPTLAPFAAVIAAQVRCARTDGSASAATKALMQLADAADAAISHTGTTGAAITVPAQVVNAVVDAHSKCSDGSFGAVLRVLEAMGPHVRLDTVSYNTAINAAAKCADGSARAARGLLDRMGKHGVAPNMVTYHSVLDAQLRHRDGSVGAYLGGRRVAGGGWRVACERCSVWRLHSAWRVHSVFCVVCVACHIFYIFPNCAIVCHVDV